MRKWWTVILLSLVWILTVNLLRAVEPPADARTRAAIEKIFRDNEKKYTATHASDLKDYGQVAFDVVATFLTDDEIGDAAASVLIEMNPKKAGPVIFASMPKSDRNVQYHTFRYYNRVIQEGQRFPFTKAMHDAAVRCLKAKTTADAAVEALYAIGLTGGKDDFTLLLQQYNNKHPVELWRERVRNAAEAALARLGRAESINSIKQQLSAPLPKVLNFDWAVAIDASIQKAAFTDNPVFIPFLCRHLSDPAPAVNGDNLPPIPSNSAAMALDRLGKHTSRDVAEALTYWRTWWKKHKSEYRS